MRALDNNHFRMCRLVSESESPFDDRRLHGICEMETKNLLRATLPACPWNVIDQRGNVQNAVLRTISLTRPSSMTKRTKIRTNAGWPSTVKASQHTAAIQSEAMSKKLHATKFGVWARKNSIKVYRNHVLVKVRQFHSYQPTFWS